MKSSSIDGLTFLGDYANDDAQIKLERYLEMRMLLDRKSAKTPYRYQYHLPNNAGVVQFAESGMDVKPIRMDFNPKRASDRDTRVMYKNIIRHLKYIEVSRIDSAFDYAEDLETVRWVDLDGRKEYEHRHGAKMDLQTIYVGSRYSDFQIVMYNKAEERRVKDRIALDSDDEEWWRIEVRMQGKKSCARFMNEDSFNPFARIKAHSDFPLGLSELKPTDQAVLLGLLTPHGGKILSEMSRPTRAKYKKMLDSYTMPLSIDPEADFEAQKKDLREQVSYWLSHQMATVF